MTLKEIAGVTGAAYRTVASYARHAGWTQNGVKTELNESQVTTILEAMKQSTGHGGHRAEHGKDDLASAMQGIETSQSIDLQIALAERQARIAQERVSELWKKRAIRAEESLKSTENLLHYRTSGLKAIQDIAEAGGLIRSDKDDLNSQYYR